MLPWLLIFIASICSTIGNVFMKKTAENFNSGDYYIASTSGLVGTVFFVVNLILFVLALRQIDVSVAYPFLSMSSFLILSATAFVIFNESFGITKIIALILIMLGLVLLLFSND